MANVIKHCDNINVQFYINLLGILETTTPFKIKIPRWLIYTKKYLAVKLTKYIEAILEHLIITFLFWIVGFGRFIRQL